VCLRGPACRCEISGTGVLCGAVWPSGGPPRLRLPAPQYGGLSDQVPGGHCTVQAWTEDRCVGARAPMCQPQAPSLSRDHKVVIRAAVSHPMQASQNPLPWGSGQLPAFLPQVPKKEFYCSRALTCGSGIKSALAVRARDHDHVQDIFFYSAEILGREQSQGRQTGTNITLWKAGRGVVDGQWAYSAGGG
jgi:hypothetical protein